MSDIAKKTGYERIAIVGAGSMGSDMALLFAEKGHKISLFDVEKENLENAEKFAKESDLHVDTFNDYESFVKSLDEKNRLFMFSITHGSPADEVLKELKPLFRKGDIVIDGGNEWYLNTRRREKELKELGVGYVGTGVSGGYQSARRGPSMSPGGEEEVVKKVMPFLENIAAKDHYEGGNNEPCVARMGPEGSGHYVKMIHNGIEQGELSGISEIFELLHTCQGYRDDEVGKIFEKWHKEGELKENFLIEIAADISQRRDDKNPDHPHTLSKIQDKITQDATSSEGTGYWTVSEASMRHVSCPTIATAHFLRIASADRAQRVKVGELTQLDKHSNYKATKDNQDDRRREITTEDLRIVTYIVTLCSYIQGLNLLAKASATEEWNVSLASCIFIWRAGCIIRSSYIANFLQPLLEKHSDTTNLLMIPEVAKEIQRCFPTLKKVVSKGIEWDAHIPSISATLEYIKYTSGQRLPTNFEEAMLDYFGAHSYDLVSEGAGTVKKGKHHTEWKPA